MRSALVPILLAPPGWVLRPGGKIATVDTDFSNNRAWVKGVGSVSIASLLTTTRASNETSLLPSSASGAAYLTFSSNVPAIVPGLGLQPFQAATNLLLNSAAPITQTTASLGTGTYTLWVNGSGSATSSAGSATGSAFGAATNGNPNTFTLSVAGTVVVTVAGSPNAFQLQAGSIGTAFVVTAGVTASQAADVITPAGALATALALTTKSVVVATNKLSAGALVVLLSAKTGNGGTYLYYNSSTLSTYYGLGGSGGAGSVLAVGAGITLSAANKAAASFDGTGRSLVSNNGTVATDSGVQGANGTVTIGSDAGGTISFANGYISRLTVFNSRIPDAQLKALTQ